MKNVFRSLAAISIILFFSKVDANASCLEGVRLILQWPGNWVAAKNEFYSGKNENKTVSDQFFATDEIVKHIYENNAESRPTEEDALAFKESLSKLKRISDNNMFAAYWVGFFYQEGFLESEQPEFSRWDEKKQRRSSIEKAIEYYLRSAKLGFLPSQFMVARWSRVLGNETDVLYWFNRASKQADRKSQEWLARYSIENAKTRESLNYEFISKGYFWFLVSKNAAFHSPINSLPLDLYLSDHTKKSFDNELLDQLSPSIVTEIQDKASNWNPISEVCK